MRRTGGSCEEKTTGAAAILRQSEGREVIMNRILAFEIHWWDPLIYLGNSNTAYFHLAVRLFDARYYLQHRS